MKTKTDNKTLNQIISNKYTFNADLTDEERTAIVSAYADVFNENYKLYMPEEAMKLLQIDENELNRLISVDDIFTVKICGYEQIPSWSIFLYCKQSAFKYRLTETGMHVDNNRNIGSSEDSCYVDYFIFDDDGFEEFAKDFYAEAWSYFSDCSRFNEYYSISDLIRIFNVSAEQVFKILGTKNINTFIYDGQICCKPDEIFKFLVRHEVHNPTLCLMSNDNRYSGWHY